MSDQHGSRPPAAWPKRAASLRSHFPARPALRWPWAGLLCSVVLGPIAYAQVHVISPEPDTTEPSTLPERHQVVDGETLSKLAEKYLGNGDAWPKLWSYNPEVTNPHWIYPGLVLKLKEGVTGGSEADQALAAASAKGAGSPSTLRFAERRKLNAGPDAIVIGEEVYLDREALEQAARIVGSAEDHLMLSPTDEVYLKFKSDDAVPAAGTELTVFLRQHREEIAPKAHRIPLHNYPAGSVGEVVRVLGALRIKSYDSERHVARAVVTEALDPIERGFEVADVPRRLAAVPPKQNAQSAKMTIVAATRALSTLGNGQVVFLDKGSNQGVQVGNRLQVVRQGDPWRQNLMLREDLTGAERPEHKPPADTAYPPEDVAELRVLYVRPESATALITSTTVELNPGEHVEMRAGY
jgi:hypothetical protein